MVTLNLEKQLLFYGAYHHDPVNVAIHVTCVPLILWTAILFCTNTPSIPLPDAVTIPNMPVNLGTIVSSLYLGLYFLMDPVATSILTPFFLGATAFANYLTSTYGMTANYYALGLHLVSWIAQFVGHGVYEGRAPALLDNLVQALVLAPFFVWLEVLFKAINYRPELKARLEKNVSEEIAKFKAQKSKANGVESKATN